MSMTPLKDFLTLAIEKIKKRYQWDINEKENIVSIPETALFNGTPKT
jgi:hypothetical protein